MDKELQIRLNFLDEAEAYFDHMESNLLGLANSELNCQQVDLVLRSAHSIKGGAAMMGFATLSSTSHRLEDFLKILRVRYTNSQIDTEIETLLLKGVDCLRSISELNRQGVEVTDADVSDRTQPIFTKLKQYLGNLEAQDEDALMAQDENVDPALLVFEEGVDTVLDQFESRLRELTKEDLAQELNLVVEELMGLGKMADLDPFVQLCQSIQQQASTVSQADISSLVNRALKTWRRSHALVLRGSIEKLPSSLKSNSPVNQDDSNLAQSVPETRAVLESDRQEADLGLLADNSLELTGLQSAFEDSDRETETDFELLANDSLELTGLQSAFEDSDRETETDFELLANDSLELTGLQSAFEDSDRETETDFELLADNSLELTGLQSAFTGKTSAEEQVQISLNTYNGSPYRVLQQNPSLDKMVRVSVSQLKQFNNLFEQLVLDRNTINLRLQQLQNVTSLMRQRISQIESSNIQLKHWYDHALVEVFLTDREQLTQNTVNLVTRDLPLLSSRVLNDRFDALEMDRYSEIHPICQEQMETIVQLQEVATDIELGLQDLKQAARNLNYTTNSMQGNVNRTQMLPFSEVVKRFFRVIRDLNLQFNKQVNLDIIGEDTLLDRSVIEALNDPLMHLLRNSFSHGIEDPQTRIAANKNPSGTIKIQAKNQGTYTVITLSDDGRGISLDKIRDRVVQMGIPDSEVIKIPENELLNFIFEPGFSTAKEVTELSGRGVGMDVVKTNLQAIRGDVRVTTELGKGTNITLRVPFTLSILRVAVIEQAGIIFAIPANSIRELIPIKSQLISSLAETKNLLWNQTKIPLVEIEKIMAYRHSPHTINLTGNPAIDKAMAIVIGDEESLAAIQISRFWYEQESTIRSIDSIFPLPPGVISSVVFGDGKVIPLVDPILLIEQYWKNNSINEPSSQDSLESSNLSAIKTILVVDDSINVRRYLSLTLEKAGYRVEQAKDGQEAVDRLMGGLSVQAVICDLEMPRLDGYGVLEELKEKAEFAHLPIAMLTTRSNEKHRKLAINLGASAYFSKPYDEQELLDKLVELIPN